MVAVNSSSNTIHSPTAVQPALSRWRFLIASPSEFQLADHPGSALRGAFGHALRFSHCLCPDESHRSDCLYAQVFEGGHAGNNLHAPSFVISSPTAAEKKGSVQSWTFSVTFLGTSAHIDQQLIKCWALALNRGLGEPRISCELVAVEPVPLNWHPLDQRLGLTLTSPWLIKRQGKPLRAGSCRVHDLLIALAQRQRQLDQHYPLGLNPPSNNQLLALADQIDAELTLADAHWHRRSNRQQHKHALEGVIGSVQLRHPDPAGLAPLTRLLNLGCWLHAGGKTAFGLGGMTLHPAVSTGRLYAFPGIQTKESL